VDNLNKSGAVRSADADLFSYTSLPMLGLMGVARTAVEGKTKYGRLNYKQGMPVHQYLDHAIHHLVKYTAGDRSEPNLEHAAWGLLAAVESAILHPELNAPHDLGPGSTITPAIHAHLDSIRDDLTARRRAGEFAKIGQWRLADLPDVRDLLRERERMTLAGKTFAEPEADPLVLEMAEFLKGNDDCVVTDQEFCPCDKCSFDAKDLAAEKAFWANGHSDPDTPGPEIEPLVASIDAGFSASSPADAHRAMFLPVDAAANFRASLEKRLGVTDDDMKAFEATKLRPMTEAERARQLRIPAITEAAQYELRLAAGWDVPDKAGTVETKRFRREEDGKLTVIGHTTTFRDGSAIDRMTELAIRGEAPTLAYTEEDRRRDLENQIKADVSHAEWVAEKGRAWLGCDGRHDNPDVYQS
jgi:hypothetical protein